MIQTDLAALKARISLVFEQNGLSSLLDQTRIDRLAYLTDRLLQENEKYNLTAIKEPNKIVLNHHADCAALALRIPHGATVCDVGCGGGFPTLPLAILRPDLTVLAIDSTAKKVGYVQESARLLGLTNVTARCMRAEEGAQDARLRESFAVVTARAVAQMRILAELCLPFVRPGGQMIAMKGKNAHAELTEAERAIATLGAEIQQVEEVTLSDGEETLCHPLIFLRKVRSTPVAYPRPYAKILKKPL